MYVDLLFSYTFNRVVMKTALEFTVNVFITDQSKSTLDISPSSLVVFSSSNVLLPSSMQSNNLLTSLILSSLTETLSPSPATLSPSPPTLSPSS